MKYEIIEGEVLSETDFALIIKFGCCNDALAAAKAINESTETNSPGTVSEGNTGAFRVGRCVVFNAYNQACYDKFLKTIDSLESPAEPGDPAVDSLARTLWDGMVKPGRKVHVDRDAAIAYLRAMFPEAEISVNDVDSFYFDYCGVEYTMVLAYDRDENDELHGGKIIVHASKSEPVTINCLTRDVKGTLEKFFKKAKSAGDSKKSSGDSKNSAGNSPDSLAARLWDRMADPDVDERDDTDAAIAYLESVLPRADIRKTESGFIHIEYKGMEYIVTPYYFLGEDGGYLQFYNKQTDVVDLEIDRDTEKPDEQVRKLFEFTTIASLMDRLDKLDAEIKTFNAKIRTITAEIKTIKTIKKIKKTIHK